jgi:Arc/MetJ-type ribon-helix-helix transcriptional regulator
MEQMLTNIQSVTQVLVENTTNVKSFSSASEVGRSGLQEVAEDIQEIARQSEGLLEINAVIVEDNVNVAVNKINELSVHNKDSIKVLVQEVSKFKVAS